MKILAIESSCDETAAAVVENGRTVLSSVVNTQIEEHKKYGGVVPEIASRRHTENICGVVEKALSDAGLALPEIDAVAVTAAPGLIGALLVVLSVLGAFESPTVQACVPQMLEGEDLVQGNAVVAQVQAVASLATPFLGSVLYAAVGLVPVLWGAAGCFLVTALLECFLQLPPPAPVEGLGVATPDQAVRLKHTTITPLGDDFLLESEVENHVYRDR